VASDSDPRNRQDGLGWVTRAVFEDPRLHLRLHRGTLPDLPGLRAVGSYAVVPSVRRARFLLPIASRDVAVASTLAYNALRPARVRLNRIAVGALAGLGAIRLTGMPTLTVSVPDGADPAELLLTEHLAVLLGEPLHAAVGVRPPDPHHKPTLQLFDGRGRPRAYAKIGWNPATRAMARAEAAALATVPRTGEDLPDVPHLQRVVEWADRVVVLVEPMPGGVRRIDRPDEPRVEAMLAVARRGGLPAAPRPLDGSPYLATLTRRAAEQPGSSDPAASARGVGEQPGERIRHLVDAFALRHGAIRTEYGDWHGDWVPWNLGHHAGRLVAWDWEHRAAGVPVGLDLAHQAFQTALQLRGMPVAEAAGEMDAWLARHGARLGLAAEQRRLVADAYLIELWLRTAEIAAGGAGWNTRLHPVLLDTIERRLGVPAVAAETVVAEGGR
jgi:hypothetical protein